MEEYSRVDRLASIEAKLDILIHHLDLRIHNDSLMEQGLFNDFFFVSRRSCL